MIRIPLQFVKTAGGILLVAGVLWLVWFFLPGPTVERKFSSLLSSVEKRNWEAFSGMLSPDYSDRWGQTAESLPSLAREGFQHFYYLKITPEFRPEAIASGGREMRISAKLHFSGGGSPLAVMVMDEANALGESFEFTYRKESWKPWDWKLVSMDHPALQLPGGWR